MSNPYNLHNITDELMDEIAVALKNVSPFGSVEIYVQNGVVTQITMRNIKKTTSDQSKFRTDNNRHKNIMSSKIS